MIIDLTPVSGTPQKIRTDSILWFYDDGSGNYFAAVAYYSRFASVLQIAEDPAALAGAVGPNFISLTHATYVGLYINCDLIGRIEDIGGTDTLIVMKVGDVYQAEITVTETVGDVETAINAAAVPPGSTTLTGDVTGSGTGSFAATIANNAVTYAKMQDVSAASKLIGRGDSGSGDPQEITIGSGLAMTGTTLSATGGGGFDPNKTLAYINSQ